MRWICIAGLAVLFVFTALGWNFRKTTIVRIYGKRWHNGLLACCLCAGSRLKRSTKKEKELLEKLYPLSDMAEVFTKRQIYVGQWVIGAWFLIHLLGLLFSVVFSEKDSILDEVYIARQADDGVPETVVTSVYGESFVIEDYAVEVRDQLLEGDARAQLFEQSKNYILENLAGENTSLEDVQYPLNLVSNIPETSMQISWNLDEASCIMPDGSLDLNQVPDEGIWQSISATLKYGDASEVLDVNVKIYPADKTREILIREALDENFQKQNADSENDTYLELPKEILGYEIQWAQARTNMAEKMTLLCLILVIVLGFYTRNREKQKLQYRMLQLVNDYPKFIHKLVLLTGAGLNMRSALEVMVSHSKLHGQGGEHYVYTEIAVILKLMQQGTPEIMAYEIFGKRCGDRLYIKLSMMMVQWVKKGAAGMNTMMSAMAQEALLLHKDQMKQYGEQAGTKLLMPMGLILVVVFMILVVPAFLSMNM